MNAKAVERCFRRSCSERGLCGVHHEIVAPFAGRVIVTDLRMKLHGFLDDQQPGQAIRWLSSEFCIDGASCLVGGLCLEGVC